MVKVTPEQLNAAADALQRESKRTQGLLQAAEALTTLGSLTAHALEVEKRIAEGSRELAQRHQELARAAEDLDRARRQAVDIGKAAAEECTRLRAEATQTALKVHADAVADAQRIVENADAEAKRVVNDALKFKQTSDQDVATARLELGVLTRTIGEHRTELGELEAKLNLARLAAAKVLSDATSAQAA